VERIAETFATGLDVVDASFDFVLHVFDLCEKLLSLLSILVDLRKINSYHFLGIFDACE